MVAPLYTFIIQLPDGQQIIKQTNDINEYNCWLQEQKKLYEGQEIKSRQLLKG